MSYPGVRSASTGTSDAKDSASSKGLPDGLSRNSDSSSHSVESRESMMLWKMSDDCISECYWLRKVDVIRPKAKRNEREFDNERLEGARTNVRKEGQNGLPNYLQAVITRIRTLFH